MSIMSNDSSFTKRDTQVVKGVAIIFMIYHHCFLSPERYQGQVVSFWPFSESLINYISLSMKLCVALFVFLSAYALTLNINHIKDPTLLKEKIIHRYLRTMSGFYFVFLTLNLFSILTNKGWYTHVYGTGIKSIAYFIIDGMGLAELFKTPQFIATFWYMSLAQLLIITLPILLLIYKRFGSIVLFGIAILITTFFVVDPSKYTFAFYPHYIICIAFGIVSADKDLLKRFKSLCNGHIFLKMIKLILLLLVITLLVVIRLYTRHTPLLGVWEGILAFLITGVTFEFISDIPLLSSLLSILGKYSMNIFLIHNFIRIAWYYDFTYSFKHFIVIGAVLLSISFVISFIIEKTKVIIRYEKLVDIAEKKLCPHL